MKRLFTILILILAALLCACTEQEKAQQEAINRASERAAYIPKNDLEFKNYDRRNRVADDPTTILWCTSSFPIPSSPLFTIPVVGKVTSGGKRTFQNDPGPDGMYGSSGEYNYGFTPAGTLAEWKLMPSFCTNEPLVWQREKTVIAMDIDSALMQAQAAARQALQKGDTETAKRLLGTAIGQVQH